MAMLPNEIEAMLPNESFGWLVSTPSSKDVDPNTLRKLKKFSVEAGGGPFKFEVGDLVDTYDQEGSLDHTVWIEIYKKDSNSKVAEISMELSDNTDGPLSSNKIIRAVCLSKLGFLEESKASAEEEEEEEEEPLPAEPSEEEPLPAEPSTAEEDFGLPDLAHQSNLRYLQASMLLKSINGAQESISQRVSPSISALTRFIRGTHD